MRIFYFLLFFSACFCGFACRNTPPVTAEKAETELTVCVPFDAYHTLTFVGIADAQAAIVEDTMTTYFQNLTALDMAMQMRDADLQYENRDSLLPHYQRFLRAHVLHFSAAERDIILQYNGEVARSIQKLQTNLLPRDIRYIKTDGKIYGDMTYFTRQNCIFIPETALKLALKGDTLRFRNTIAHEVFHLISRYKPSMARQMYARIGFDTIQHLSLADTLLAARILSNPDGTNPYKIRLSDSITGTMLSLASSTDFDDSEPFEAHLNWDMYAIERHKGEWQVQADSLGESTLSNTWEASFYKKASTNTDYTLHPEEMLAENFVLLLRSKTETKPLEIDNEGRALLRDLERILKGGKIR
jgi:hypothetical protein